MAKIALIGATGFVGAAVLKEAASRDHSVTALVRNTDKVAKLDNVTAVKTDVYDTDALAKQIAGSDIIISAFNPGWADANIRENTSKVAVPSVKLRKSGCEASDRSWRRR